MNRFGISMAAFSFSLVAMGQAEPGKVTVEGIVGHYRFDSGQIISLESFGDNVTAKSRGVPQNVLTPSPDGRFSYSSNPAYLTFGLDAKGTANALQYHFEDRVEMAKRIDDATFDADTNAWNVKIKDQTHSPECAAAVRRLIDDVRAGSPNYSLLSPALSRTIRSQLPVVQPRFAAAGLTKEVNFKSVDSSGNEIFEVILENSSVQTWRVLCLPNGYLVSAAFRL
jgi:hypothetical protein